MKFKACSYCAKHFNLFLITLSSQSDARKTVVGEAITWQASTSLEKPRVPPIQGIASVTIDPNRNFSALLRIENVLGIPNPVLVNGKITIFFFFSAPGLAFELCCSNCEVALLTLD